MNIEGIEHIGIAVNALNKEGVFWKYFLKNIKSKIETIEDQGVITEIFDTGNGKIELLEEINNDSPINTFLKKRGPGVHHISFKVQNIEEAIADLKKNNVKLVTENWSLGAEGYKVIFIHPKATGGVLVELTEV